MDAELSAVIVPVPEAEPLVGRLRAELDVHASWGVPAHVTVLFPFLAPAAVDDGVLATLAETVAATPAFTTTFTRVEWFGEGVVWLAPEPAVPFVALMTTIHARFGLAPYGGAHGGEPVPHLTVGHQAPVRRLRAAAVELARGLPVEATIRSVRLIGGRRAVDTWTTLAEFPLAGRGRMHT